MSKLPTSLSKYKPQSRTGIPIKSSSSRLPMSEPRIKPSEPSSDTIRTYCTEDTPAMLSHAGSNSDLSVLSINSKPVDDKPDFSDDSSNLSGDNDNILAECIQSGMPKARRQLIPPKVKPKLLPQRLNMPYLEAKDEMENYAIEDSPCQFSLHSSLSDLTVDGGNIAGLAQYKKPKENAQNEASNLQKVDSLSSLSVDSFGSTENAEQALLEQCISSGMPKSNKASRNFADTSPTENKSSKNVFATSVVTNTELTADVEKADTKIKAKNINIEHGNNGFNSNSYNKNKHNSLDENLYSNKNIYDNSVQPNSIEENMYSSDKNKYDINKCSDVLTDCSIEDNASPESSDSENKSKRINNRMLDPDAMIESLDRFTAELVSHSSHLNSHECKLPSNEGNNTWDEDTSPNDISFPSISISAPLVASFKSETESKDTIDGQNNIEKEENQFSSFNTMSESTIIAMEATKVYNVVQLEANMMRSITSIHSVDLENINPPSMMESMISLTSSASEFKNSPKNSPLLRKRSVPVMVRRALGNANTKSVENLDSISNLEHIKPPSVIGDYLDMVDMESSMVSVASITSEVAETKDESKKDNTHKWYYDIESPHLTGSCDIENINPPSLLNEVTDMCNSTADIITEHIYSQTEVFEDCFTHTFDQTLQPEDLMTADEVTEYSDAHSVTPIQSDFALSSPEATPKKHKNVNKRLTPRQKRQLAKERFKTYTVAAEMVTREVNRPEMITESPDSNGSLDISSASSCGSPKLTPKERRLLDRERFQTRVLEKSPELSERDKFSTFSRKPKSSSSSENGDKFGTFSKKSLSSAANEDFTTANSSLQMSLSKFATFSKKSIESTYQNSSIAKLDIKKATEYASEVQKSLLQSPKTPPMSPKSRSKTDIRKSMQQKRIENKERFRTRTISTDSPSPETSPALERRQMTAEELHTMLEHETNIVLDTLAHTSGVDDYLECETLSLVSNDDDSENNSMSSVNYRTYHKSWAFSKNLPVVEAQSKCLPSSQNQLENIHGTKTNLPVAKNTVSVSKMITEESVSCENESESDEHKSPKITKPKIVKPRETVNKTQEEPEEQVKAIRGKKKAYISPYRSPNLTRPKPTKTVNSNLVKNVTSALTSTASVLNRSKITPPTVRSPQKSLKPPTGVNRTPANRTSLPISAQKQTQKRQSLPPKVERQGTFVKETENEPESPEKSKVSTSKIARAIGACKSKSATSLKTPKLQSKNVTSTTKTEVGRSTFYSRSPSADRDFVSRVKKFGMHASTSSQSLQSQESVKGKKSSIPSMTPRSNSNVSIASNESVKKKQVTSKIASLWKRVEESKKKQPEKKDSKVWITPSNSTEQTNCDSTVVSF